MENKKFEFVLECTRRLVPDTGWHGDSYKDQESIENIDLLAEMIYILLEELYEHSHVPEGNKDWYFEKIANKKRNVLENVIDYCNPSDYGYIRKNSEEPEIEGDE